MTKAFADAGERRGPSGESASGHRDFGPREEMAKVGGPDLWETRLKEKHPMLQYFTDRPFGVEIEIFGLKYSISTGDRLVIPPYQIMNRSQDGRRLPQVFQDQGLVLNGYSPDAPAYQAWSFVLDDTIKGAGGSELVSPVLSGLQGLAQVYRVLLLIQKFPEILANETCGFHVHHGVERTVYGNRELFHLLRIISIFEDYIYQLLPEERRQAETCRPLEVDLCDWYRREGCDQPIPRVRGLWYSPENRDDLKTPRRRKLHPTRYHGLNLHSYWYRGTIEFRYYPSAIQEPEELMQWIIFSQFLVEWGQGRRPVLEYVRQPNKWLNTLYKIYLVAGMLSHIHFPLPAGEEGEKPA